MVTGPAGAVRGGPREQDAQRTSDAQRSSQEGKARTHHDGRAPGSRRDAGRPFCSVRTLGDPEAVALASVFGPRVSAAMVRRGISSLTKAVRSASVRAACLLDGGAGP